SIEQRRGTGTCRMQPLTRGSAPTRWDKCQGSRGGGKPVSVGANAAFPGSSRKPSRPLVVQADFARHFRGAHRNGYAPKRGGCWFSTGPEATLDGSWRSQARPTWGLVMSTSHEQGAPKPDKSTRAAPGSSPTSLGAKSSS